MKKKKIKNISHCPKTYKISTRLAARQRRMNELYEKVGRSSQFKSKKERDNWLQQEVTQGNAQLSDRRKTQSSLQSEIKENEEHIENLSKNLSSKKSMLDEKAKESEKGSKEYQTQQSMRDELNNRRK